MGNLRIASNTWLWGINSSTFQNIYYFSLFPTLMLFFYLHRSKFLSHITFFSFLKNVFEYFLCDMFTTIKFSTLVWNSHFFFFSFWGITPRARILSWWDFFPQFYYFIFLPFSGFNGEVRNNFYLFPSIVFLFLVSFHFFFYLAWFSSVKNNILKCRLFIWISVYKYQYYSTWKVLILVLFSTCVIQSTQCIFSNFLIWKFREWQEFKTIEILLIKNIS